MGEEVEMERWDRGNEDRGIVLGIVPSAFSRRRGEMQAFGRIGVDTDFRVWYLLIYKDGNRQKERGDGGG